MSEQVRDLLGASDVGSGDDADRKRLLRAAIQMGLMSQSKSTPSSPILSSAEGRVAAVLVALGADIASQVIQDFNAPEAQRVTALLASTKALSRDDIITVLQDFKEATENTVPFDVRNLLSGVLGGEFLENGELTYRQKKTQKIPFYGVLCDMQSSTLARYIEAEHSQFAAALMALLPPDMSAKILQLFAARKRAEVIQRISQLKSIDDSMLEHINNWVTSIVNQHFVDAKGVDDADIGGVDPVVDIISSLSGKMELKAIEEIKELNPDLGKKIDEKMFYFDDLYSLDDNDAARLIRDIPRETLSIALKGSTEKIAKKFFENMSERQKLQVEFEMNSLPPLRVSDIEEKQKEILQIARQLQKQKLIVLLKSN